MSESSASIDEAPQLITKAQAARSAKAARQLSRKRVRKKVDVVMSNGGRPDLRIEKELLRGGVARLAAMDEVGRGALAGPVTVGVVVVTSAVGRVPAGLKDSKLLSPAHRDALVPAIRRWIPEHGVGHAWPDEIDRIGIIAALRLAARRALDLLNAPVDAVLLDGNHNYLAEPDPALFDLVAAQAGTPTRTETEPLRVDPARLVRAIAEDRRFEAPAAVRTRIKADLTCAGVAGASVLAKTTRDRLLVALAPEHPAFQFEINKGYGTPEHIAALRKFGPSVVHRRSWNLPCAGSDPDVIDDYDPDLAALLAESLGQLAEPTRLAAGPPSTPRRRVNNDAGTGATRRR